MKKNRSIVNGLINARAIQAKIQESNLKFALTLNDSIGLKAKKLRLTIRQALSQAAYTGTGERLQTPRLSLMSTIK